MKWCTLALIAVSFMHGVAAAEDDAAKKDLERLQGVWQCVSLEGGNGIPADKLKELQLTIKGNKASHPGSSDGKVEEATLELDPSKTPKAIDMLPLTGSGDRKPLLGIYSIAGDIFKICGAKPGGDRPTEFKASKDASLIVFERIKR